MLTRVITVVLALSKRGDKQGEFIFITEKNQLVMGANQDSLSGPTIPMFHVQATDAALSKTAPSLQTLLNAAEVKTLNISNIVEIAPLAPEYLPSRDSARAKGTKQHQTACFP